MNEARYNVRAYKRTDGFRCDASISENGVVWEYAEISDLSSGGLSLRSNAEYEIGKELYFDLQIIGFLTEFNINVKGIVRRKSSARDYTIYGISFLNIHDDLKIRIDEAINKFTPKGMWY